MMEDTHPSKKALTLSQPRKSIALVPSPEVNTDKENVTIDSVARLSSIGHAKLTSRKPRSKSIGPGGLDMLREDAGNRRQSVVAPLVKSILKPTTRLSPTKQIAPFPSSRGASPRPSSITTPENSHKVSSSDASIWKISNPVSGNNGLPNPFERPADPTSSLSPSQIRTKVATTTEATQHAAAKERERQQALAHKDARRKSLANRRVSFAPEATLHIWDVVEIPEDSTTSSASTSSTRRASALSAIAVSPYPQPRSQNPSSKTSNEPPSTPQEQVEEVQVTASPARQRNMHQKNHRRTSEIPPLNCNNPDDSSSSPGSVTTDDSASQAYILADEGESSNSDVDDNDSLVEGEDTAAGMNGDDITTRSNEGSSTGSSGKLEQALRQAAIQAGTQGIDYDEHGDITMEMADDEVTAAFKPWMKKGKYVPQIVGDPSTLQDKENTNPFSPAFKANISEGVRAIDFERTMEFTKAVGGILPHREEIHLSTGISSRKSTSGNRRRSSGASRRSSTDGSLLDDETMDLTTAIGGIQQNQSLHKRVEANKDSESIDEDEELTMEYTSVVGGVLEYRKKALGRSDSIINNNITGRHPNDKANRHDSEDSLYNEEDMEITIAQGGILLSTTENTYSAEDQIRDIDNTSTVGAILSQQLNLGSKTEDKNLMGRKADMSQLSDPEFPGNLFAGSGAPSHAATIASETGSPSLTASQRRVSPTKIAAAKKSVMPEPGSCQSTPLKRTTTPFKQLTPELARPTTPGKTPPFKNISLRTGSPKKLFRAEIKNIQPSPQPSTSYSLFRNSANSKEAIPSIILKPRRCRSSGLGIDKEGLGSPRVTALLDRRRSIGDDARAFAPQDQLLRVVRLDNPKVLEQELENQRTEDEYRESGRGILRMEADSQEFQEEMDVTTNLKGLIESLTPQKKKLSGRKSLRVGAAKGLLGKRPTELDEDDEDLTPKRLKGWEGSPVKKVRLPAPPSKVETTGRMTPSGRFSIAESTGNRNVRTPSRGPSPLKIPPGTTLIDRPGFKDAQTQPSASKLTGWFDQRLDADKLVVIPLAERDNRIHLQDFLNLTSIRFMELTTTKRRLTVASSLALESGAKQRDDGLAFGLPAENDKDLENCVAAGACTVPMLELYQHSCRELKKYIAEGRSIVREIEADTFEDNPPLFCEYISAPPDLKSLMDNQFKNVKTRARLLSKAMWYEWRMKLLEGLKDGLLRVSEGMDEDDKVLAQQERILQSALPELAQEHDRLETDRQILQANADELASCDQEELQDARDNLVAVEKDVQIKQRMVEDLQRELRRQEEEFGRAIKHKQHCLEEIKESERIRQEYKGWSPSEVTALQGIVDGLEKSHGWTITSAAGTSLTMTYQRTLQLFFTPSSFMQTVPPISPTTNPENFPMSLTYIVDADEYRARTLTTEKRFFLQIMRVQLQCLPQRRTRIQDLLGLVSDNWKKACVIAEEVRELDTSFITEPIIQSDEIMMVRSMLLLRDKRTKIEIGFKVTVQSRETAVKLDFTIQPSARVVYGESLKEKKMVKFLEQKIGGKSGGGLWAKSVKELKERLITLGRK